MQKIFKIIEWLFKKITGKKLFYITQNKNNALGKTAVLSELGFWYVGDVYDRSDIAYGIAQSGLVEKDDTRLVIKILSELSKPVVYDIGANTGYYGILAATKFDAEVHSFEPITEYISCIEVSARINRADTRIHLHPFALGSKQASLELSLSGSGSTLTNNFLGKNFTSKLKVEVKTLDSLKLPAPQFIKIDVEGFEWEVLKGAVDTIKTYRPICFIEIAKTFSKRNFVHQHWNQIINLFKELNYKIERSSHGGLVPLDSDIPDGVQMYLFTPIKQDF